MPSTYTPIASTTLGSSTSSVTFSSLGSYTDLFISCSVFPDTTVSRYLTLRFNGDSGNNYNSNQIAGLTSGIESGQDPNTPHIYINGYGAMLNDSTTAFPMMVKINIMNYGNSTSYKSVIFTADQSKVGGSTYTGIGMWRNTDPITSVSLQCNTYNLGTNSVFSIYGIKAA
jgi:hypothetical protein